MLHVDGTVEDTLAVTFNLFPILRVMFFAIKAQNPAYVRNLNAHDRLAFLSYPSQSLEVSYK